MIENTRRVGENGNGSLEGAFVRVPATPNRPGVADS